MNRFYIVSCALFGFIDDSNALTLATDFGHADTPDAALEIESETDPEGKENYTSSWEAEMQKLRNLALLRHTESKLRSRKPERRLAILVAGLQNRVLLASKVKNVIRRSAAQGYTTDLYMSLVKSGITSDRQSYSLMPNTIDSPESSDERAIREAIEGVGKLMTYTLLSHQLDIHVPIHHPKRLSDYLDCTQKGCPKPPGINVLRKYKAVEILFNRTLTNGVDYDFVLVTADDDEWLGPFNITEFELVANSSNTLFTKNCRTFGGINDKTQLYGAEAAKKVLGALYTDFFADSGPKMTTSNTEQYLMHFAIKRGVMLQSVQFGSLPTASSVYMQNELGGPPRLCQKHMYLCDSRDWLFKGYPNSTEFEHPTQCT